MSNDHARLWWGLKRLLVKRGCTEDHGSRGEAILSLTECMRAAGMSLEEALTIYREWRDERDVG